MADSDNTNDILNTAKKFSLEGWPLSQSNIDYERMLDFDEQIKGHHDTVF